MNRYPGFSYDPATKIGFFDCRVPGTGGKRRRRRTVHADTRAEALALWRVFVDELAREAAGDAPASPTQVTSIPITSIVSMPSPPPLPAPTLRDFVDAYYRPTIRAAFKRRTQVSHDSIIGRQLLPAFGNMPLDAISAVVVTDFKVALRNAEYRRGKGALRTYAPSYINDCVRVLKMLLHQAVARGVITVYPIKEKLLKEKEPVLRLELSDGERRAFLATFDDAVAFAAHLTATQTKGKLVRSDRFGGNVRRFGGGMRCDSPAARRYFARFRWLKPLMVFALETGVRRGDMLKLAWSSIDLRAGWIRLTMEKTEFEATIAISRACQAALDECRRRAPKSMLVFVDESGRPLSETRVRRAFALAKKLAGITRRCRFHDLRHTFASRLISSYGVSLRVVATALGHTTTEQTERYAKPSEFAMRQIKTALDSDIAYAPAPSGIPAHSAA
jgi:integrase